MKKISVEKIISGGQTGADRAALDFAIDFSIPHGGACPKGRFAEDGVLPERYKMYEVGDKVEELIVNYSKRTIENIKQSDGTLIIVPIFPLPKGLSDGTAMTIDQADALNKPYVIYQIGLTNVDEIIEWLISKQIKILNVAGPRLSSFPQIYDATYSILEAIFNQSEHTE